MPSESNFEAQTDSGRELQKKGFQFHFDQDNYLKPRGNEKYVQVSARHPSNEYPSYITARIKSDGKTAHIVQVEVPRKMRQQGSWEALYREMGQHLKDQGVSNVTGDVINEHAGDIRSKVFPNSTFAGKPADSTPFGNIGEARSPITPDSRFMPSESGDVKEMAIRTKDGMIHTGGPMHFMATEQALSHANTLPPDQRMELKRQLARG